MRTEGDSADTNLQRMEQRFRNLAEGSIQGLVVLQDNAPVFANQAIADMLGYDAPDDVLKVLSANEFLHPDEVERVAGYRKARLKGEPAPDIYEVRAVRRDRSTVWLDLRATRIEWNGSVAIQVTCIDIDKRKQATEALRNSEKKLRNLIEGSIQGIIVFDQDRPIFANQSLADILGYDTPDEILRLDSVDDFVHPEYRQRLRTSREARLRGENVTAIAEFKALRKDGSTIWLENRPTLVEWDGRIAIQSAYFDITERKRAEAEAARASLAKSEFLSSISHELRTPLNAILGFAQLLKDYPDAPLSRDQETGIAQILDSGRHLLSLVNDILDLAKIESGQIELSIQAVDPTKVIREAISVVDLLAKNNNIVLIDSTHTALASPIRADPNRLKQILLNLLSNAVKYNREKGTVRVDTTNTDTAMLRISITDTGPGIAAEDSAEVFRPFSRLGIESSTIEGTGIGLSISRQLVESMAGNIGYDSKVGEGSTFWIELPLAQPPASSHPQVP